MGIKLTTLEQLKVALLAAKAYVNGEIDNLGDLAAKNEVSYDDLASALKTLIDNKADGAALATLVGDDTGKSARAISAEEIAKVVANADADFDTLKEIADWILSDTTGAAKMAGDISRLDAILAGFGGDGEESIPTVFDAITILAEMVGDVTNNFNKHALESEERMLELEVGKIDKAEGYHLMSNDERNKLATVQKGANSTHYTTEELELPEEEDAYRYNTAVSYAAGKWLDGKISLNENRINGIIDGGFSAADAVKLGGIVHTAYARKSDLPAQATDDEVTAMCAAVFGA